jgi:hypothetical protein
MSNGTFSDEQVHRWLQEVADAGWVGLHYDDPTLGGVSRAEISGGGYARVRMSFSQPSNRSIWSLIDARFTGLVQTRLTHFSVWDSQNLGLFRASGELPTKVIVLNGKGFVVPAGQLALSLG